MSRCPLVYLAISKSLWALAIFLYEQFPKIPGITEATGISHLRDIKAIVTQKGFSFFQSKMVNELTG